MAKTKRRIRSRVVSPLAHGPIPDEPMVGTPIVAQRLGVPDSWVYAKSEAGELPSYKIGHYRRFKWSEIEEYLHKCRSAPRS